MTVLDNAVAGLKLVGGMGREDRQKAQNAFTQDVDVQVLVATDAAGEGVNLQRAHLMVNYDLPWNPNRIEQRFGRIHRIGQTEVCHMWNLVATETREGEVFQRLRAQGLVREKSLGQVLSQSNTGESGTSNTAVVAAARGKSPTVSTRRGTSSASPR